MTHAFRRILTVTLLVLSASSTAVAQGVQCRPNIFGGQDCHGVDSQFSSSSRPNIFGGVDVTGPGNLRSSSRPNIFGGQDITGPGGHATSCRPNIFGGQDCR